jgi:flagellar biosynthesis/type III secretory pathway protein FliH
MDDDGALGLTLAEGLVLLSKLEPCSDALEQYRDRDQRAAAYQVWAAAESQDIAWVYDALFPKLDGPGDSEYAAGLRAARAQRDAIYAAAQAAYSKEREEAYAAGAVNNAYLAQRKALEKRDQACNAAMAACNQRIRSLKAELEDTRRSRSAFLAVVRALRALKEG